MPAALDPPRVAERAQLTGEPHRWRCQPPPGGLVAVSGLVLVVNVLVTLAGAVTIGVSTDEPTHVSRLRTLLDQGWYVPAFLIQGGDPSARAETSGYAPVPALLGHAAAVLSGNETWSTVSESTGAYDARHVAVSLIGLVGLAAVYGIGRSMLGWRWGVVTAAVTSAIPLWTGHSMFNIKDVPSATGYTLTTLGLLLTVTRPSASSRWRDVAGAGTILVGTILTMGTRPGLWPALALSGAAAVGVAFLTEARLLGPRQAARRAMRSTAVAAAAGMAGVVALMLIYPALFIWPWRAAMASVRSSADFESWTGHTLTAGVLEPSHPSWTYVPIWFGNQIPVLILMFGALGVILGTCGSLNRLSERRSDPFTPGFVLVVLQAFAVPLFAVLHGSTLYSGVRQLLFVVPALGILAVVGMQGATGLGRGSWFPWRATVAVVACAALVLPTIDQIRLFPYNYAYLNEVATTSPIDGRWPTDSWGTSLKELQASSVPEPVDPRDHLVYSANQTGSSPPAGCRAETSVTRSLRGQTVVMGSRSVCRWALQPYPRTGVDFTSPTGLRFLLSGFGPPTRTGAWSGTSRPLLGGTLVPRPALRLQLRIGGIRGDEHPLPVTLAVNGRALKRFLLTSGHRTLRASVPRSALQAGRGAVVLELRVGRDIVPTADNPFGFTPNGVEVRELRFDSAR